MAPAKKRKQPPIDSPELSSKRKLESGSDMELTSAEGRSPDPKAKRKLVRDITTTISPIGKEKPVPETPAPGYSIVGSLQKLTPTFEGLLNMFSPKKYIGGASNENMVSKQQQKADSDAEGQESDLESNSSPTQLKPTKNRRNDFDLEQDSISSKPDSPTRTRKANSDHWSPMKTTSIRSTENRAATSSPEKLQPSFTKKLPNIQPPDFETATSEELAKYYGDLHSYYAKLHNKSNTSATKPAVMNKVSKKNVQFSPVKTVKTIGISSGSETGSPSKIDLKKLLAKDHEHNLSDLIDFTDDEGKVSEGDPSEVIFSDVDEQDSSEKERLITSNTSVANNDRYFAFDITQVQSAPLTDKELLQEIDYVKGIKALGRQFPHYSKEDICSALYMTSGIFSFAESILKHDFQFTAIEPVTQKLIFQPEDDLMLKNGNLVGLKKNKYAVDERLMFLGLANPTEQE
ncbi:hypothetical protein HDV06_005999 [Boothiomyces sp. JEL0866]|nr:hypothetical protein HDV06_005999 [Boothiomyces sp. JEL0866]